MSVLVDYACPGCRFRFEQWAASPPPTSQACPRCGATARRRFAANVLGGRTAAPSSTAPAAPSCRDFPQIPALCHMTPSARRRVVATYLKDGRSRDREIARQAARAETVAPTIGDALTPHHRPQTPSADCAPSGGAERNAHVHR